MGDVTCNDPEGCDRPILARGLCSRHYDRLRERHKRSGTPMPPWSARRRAPQTVAIYALLEPETRKPRYVGHSGNPERRLKEHWGRRAYEPYVQDNPKFSAWLRSLDRPPELHVLEVVPYGERFTAEERHTSRLRQMPGIELLNIYAGAKVPDVTRVKMRARMLGAKARPEDRAKISAGVKAYFAQLPQAELSEIVARLDHDRSGKNNGMFGRKHSPETRLKISAAVQAHNRTHRTGGAYDPDEAAADG